jgi:hypothetical protein
MCGERDTKDARDGHGQGAELRQREAATDRAYIESQAHKDVLRRRENRLSLDVAHAAASLGPSGPSRPVPAPIRLRVHDAMADAQRQRLAAQVVSKEQDHRYELAFRAKQLIEKNPEFAELLDILERI